MKIRHVLGSNLDPKNKKYFEKRVQWHMDNLTGRLSRLERFFQSPGYEAQAWVLTSRDLAKKMKRQYRNSHEI